jgi:gamma-glutamyl:cysteine ligase YbdK (ATP-grasp superfamily)
MVDTEPLHLFQAFGVELEYMVVDAETLGVRPVVDELFRSVTGGITSDVEHDDISWSNELVAHVVELKTTEPVASLVGPAVPAENRAASTSRPAQPALQFQDHVGRVNAALAPLGARLMPTAMHPWMNPTREMKLWPHDNGPVYETFHRIFDCRGHGWANLQSVHLNLPFAGDDEFGRLHAAIRLILPILPALAASSPIIEGRATGLLDSRLDVYRTNCRRVPSVTGRVIPEPVFDRSSYEVEILERMYTDISPLDPAGILRHEWLNARGAIARFDRGTIEIRVLDVQECPAADVAICGVVTAALKAIVAERWSDLDRQKRMATEPLEAILLATIRDTDQTNIGDREYLAHFGLDRRAPLTAGDLWRHIVEATGAITTEIPPEARDALATILQRGPLARRILTALDQDFSRPRLTAVYRQLCECLAAGRSFIG